MKHRHLWAIGLAVYLLAMIATAPATLVDAGLRRISQGKLRLVEARGTLWSGSGQIEMRDPGGRTGVAKSFSWRFLPLPLLRGHLVCEIGLEQADQPFPVTISLSGIELADADISLPAAALGLGVPKLAPLGLTGEILLHVANLSIGGKQMRGNATLQWRDAGSVFAPISPLGDYELKLDAADAMIHLSLRTVQGPLQLDGTGSWANGSPPDFMAVVHVPPQNQQQLDPLLRLFAVERGAGSFELRYK